MPVGEKFAPHIGQQRKKPPRPPAGSQPPRSGEDVRLGAPPPPAPVKPPRTAEDVRLGSPTTQPSFTGTPIPVLQQYGYSGSVHDLNARVGAITDAFQSRFGSLPSFGHVFNVLTSQVDDFKGLYSQVPRSTAEARAHGAMSERPYSGPLEPKEAKGQFIADLSSALTGNRIKDFESTHAEEIKDYLKDPKMAGRIFAAVQDYNANIWKSQAPRVGEGVQDQTKLKPLSDEEIGALTMQQAGLNPDLSRATKVGGGVVALGATQIVTSLIHSPAGVYQLGHAAVLDEKDMLAGKPPTRTPVIGKAMAQGVARDVRHPGQNPGFLFMDIMGFAGGGAGAVTRVARAGRALRSGEGVGVAVRTLASRPVGGTYELRVGGLGVHELQSENRAVAVLQRAFANRRNATMALRNAKDPVPAGMLSAVLPQTAEDTLGRLLYPFRKYFSSEAKVGRLFQRQSAIEHTLAMTLQRELEAVSGWSVNSWKVFSRLPQAARKGLSRGEQKAIQVLSTDDPNPFKVHEDFHNFAIEAQIGDRAAHARNLADLKLARKALEKPSPRFVKALDLTREVMERQQAIKINELGLSPLNAEARIAAPGQIMRGEGRTNAERQVEDSFYLPFVSKVRSKRPPSERFGQFQPRLGPYGMGVPQDLPELKHYFTGDSILAGNYRIDATHLASETYARTVRAAHVVDRWRKLWDAARTTKPAGAEGEFYRPIRDVRAIPDKLREIASKIDEGELTAKEAAALHPNDVDALIKAISPDPRDLAREEIPHVRWVDERLTGDLSRVPPLPTGGKRVLQTINEPFRDVILYLRPAYLLNALGNTAMGLVHQGAFLPVNVGRAIFKQHLFGEEASRTISALVGESRSRSYIADVDPFLTHASRRLAQGWNVVADKYFREAALIHELRRQGFRTGDQVQAALKNKEHSVKLNEATRRANKAMVEFENLTWFEKNTLRHFIFVYPWVSRSAIWSLRTMIEHPVQSDILVHLGHEAQENEDPVFKNAPEWFKRTGYFPVSWSKDGRPKVVNPTSVNSFSTLGELMNVLEAGTQGDQYANFGDLLGPGAQLAIHGVTGKDEFGNTYPDSQWLGAANELLAQLPQLAALKRSKNKDKALPAVDVTDRKSLAARENAALHNTVFSPGWLNGFGSLIGGGLSPRYYNPDAAAARYWQDQPWQKRHAHEMDLVRKALKMQGEFLGEKLPSGVSLALELSGKRDAAYKKFSDEHGRTPTDREKTEVDLGILATNGRITIDQSKKLAGELKKLTAPEDISRFRSGLLDEHGGAKALRQWDSDVRLVASFTKPDIVRARLGALRKDNLIQQNAYHANDKALKDIGLHVLRYMRAVRQKSKEATDQSLGSDQRSLLSDELRVWQDEQNKPIRVGGKEYPSVVAWSWSMLTPEQRAQTVASNALTPWKSLSAFDRQLLGKKSNAAISRGWQNLRIAEAILHGQIDPPKDWAGWAALPEGKRTVSKKYEAKLAKYIQNNGDNGKPIPGFYKDYLFSQEPLYRRLYSYRPIQQSPNRKSWEEVLVSAAGMDRWRYTSTASGLKDSWRDYVKTTVIPYYQQSKPAFLRELSVYGNPADVLGSLLNR